MTDPKHKAKEVSIISVLRKMGYDPANETSTKAWYNSPFRNEGVPSFVVDKKKNSWIDWGAPDKHGDGISLVMECEGVGFHDAINFLLDDTKSYKEHRPEEVPNEPTGIYILSVDEITNPYLLAYASSRGIDADLLKKYCKEVDFIFNRRPNIERKAIGFKNDKGGWELRYDKIKHGNSPKTWRTIIVDGVDSCDVFEGFFDFLSHLQWNGWDAPKNTTFILNSLVYSSFLLNDFDMFNTVNLYFDNSAGAYGYIERYFQNEKYHKMGRVVYPDHEDYNDFVKYELINNKDGKRMGT